jgi:hypothetical protein
MKKLIIFYFIFIITTVTITAQNYGLGNTDPSVFTKYRIPETILNLASINTNFTFNSSKNSQSYADSYGSSDFYSDYNSDLTYSLSPKYSYLNERDDQIFSFNANFNGSYNWKNEKLSSDVYDYDNKTITFDLGVSSSYSKYLNPDELFFSVSSNMVFNIKDRYMDHQVNHFNTFYDGEKLQNYNLFLGFGFGKIRNVTPVVSAIRMQERLKQLNLLNNDLSEDIINDLAMQFSKSGYYDSIYNRAEKYFWQDIENVLAKDGISLKGLNQFGSSFLHDVTKEIRFLRSEGLAAGVNMQLNYFNHFISVTSDANKIYEQFNIMGNAYLNFSHQLSLNSQIGGNISLSGGPNIIKRSDYKQNYSVGLNLGYDYELTDRFVLSCKNTLSLLFVNQKNPETQLKILNNNLSLSLDYFIEDMVSLNATYSLQYSEEKYQSNKSTNNINNILIGITYYLNRGFILK